MRRKLRTLLAMKLAIRANGFSCLRANSRFFETSIASSQDSWEKWEFGSEEFIDKEIARKANVVVDDETRDGYTPIKNGMFNFNEAANVLRPYISNERWLKMEDVLRQRTGNVRFIIENPINPSNAWACLRTLDSFGIQYVDVIADPACYVDRELNPRYKRMSTAMGTQKWLDINEYKCTRACVETLKAEGYRILATDLSPGAQPITELDLSTMGPFAIVMGNEERGITDEMRELCDHKIYLPMRGFAQSFSLSVGCAAIVSHLNTCGSLKPGSLDAAERDRIFFKWALDSVKGGRAIVRRAGYELPLLPDANMVLQFKQTK